MRKRNRRKVLPYIRQYFFAPRFRFSRFQFNLVAIFFIGAGILLGSYLSLKGIAHIFALNDTTQTWTFNSSTASSYTYDSSLVAVDNSGAHPITGVNLLSNPSFSSDTSSWNVQAVTGSTTPAGWVVAPGDSNYVATGAAFLVMKYDAKCAATSDPTTGLTSPTTGYNTYDNNNTACASANSKEVVSVASGYPIANISQSSAAPYCAGVTVGGSAAHLLTNNEWMAIARNAEEQGSNWSGGTTGSGYMYSGHNDNQPATALAASTDDTQGYYGETNTGGNQRRTLTLSNGSVLWDMAGNVWQWTNNTVLGTQEPSNGSGGFAWREFTSITQWGALSQAQVGPTHTAYNSSYGVGQLYSEYSTTDNNQYGFLRGGNWNNAAGAGAFALNLSNAPSSVNASVGFRCASDPVDVSQSYSSTPPAGRSGGANLVTTSSTTDTLLTQNVTIGNTNTYNISAYVYDNTTGNVGGAVDGTIAQLYAQGAAITTTYTSAGSGWYKLTGTVTGSTSSAAYGVVVKSGKTVYVDDFTLAKAGTYSVMTTTAYSNNAVHTWDSFTPTVSATGNASVVYQLCDTDGSSCDSGNSWQYWTGSAWATATDSTTTVNTAAQLTQTAMQAFPTTNHKIAVKAIMSFGGSDSPTITSIAIGMTTDTTPPTTNASGIGMQTASSGGRSVPSSGWDNSSTPYFSWTAGADNSGGVGLLGYCLYLGTDPTGDPATSKGLLGTSPVSTSGSTCQFIVSSTSVDLSTSGYIGTALTSSSSSYYLNIKAIDKADNIYTGSSAQFPFYYDGTAPTNVAYTSCASGNFSNVTDMNFSWPTSGSNASSDSNAGVLGWQYQINSSTGTWQGTTNDPTLDLDYIPATASAYTLTSARDGSAISSGSNIIYFRTVDAAGNTSPSSTYRTCSLAYGGAAPTFPGDGTVTVTPSTSTTNSFALSWPTATATTGQTVKHYYYSINNAPPSTLATLQANSGTYIDNGTTTSLAATALANVVKGTNTVYVVAIDGASTPDYSSSNDITGTFTLNSTNPDPVQNLVATDSSIKSKSQWNVTLTWTAGSYQGAGNLTYNIYRSTDNTSFSKVGSTSGLSYVDNTPSSTLYYYYVVTEDGASATSADSSTVSLTPTGRYTSAPSLQSGPTATSITAKQATITWSTDRDSDSKVEYGTTSGSYNTTEPSVSDQITSHSVTITGLTPGTTYYYKAIWTDSDGNTGTSDEKTFTTNPPPTVSGVKATSISLSSAYINFTVTNASSVAIQYGTSTSYGGQVAIDTATSETTYSVPLTGLTDGTAYHYRIVMTDSDGDAYNSDDYTDLVTLPRPRITTIRFAQVEGTAQPTVLVTWDSNTAVSSIVTYYPQGNPKAAQDQVNVALTKGAHQMIISGLDAKTTYNLIVKGRDKVGNEADSDIQTFTTATDTRPPAVSNLQIQGENIPPVGTSGQQQTAQLVVSWDTDKLATSQVEFGEGSGSTYQQKTQLDGNYTFNHLVIISNLTPSKVYHLRALSVDKAGNIGQSIDTVTITPKATDNALDLVITSLEQAFGLLGSLGK